MPYPRFLEKPYIGYNCPNRKRVRSRETFATIEAAAIEGQMPSPPTTATCSLRKCLAGKPSTRTTPENSPKACKARPIAIWLATRILCLSISSNEASPTPHFPVFPSVSRSKSSSLLFRVIFLESSKPSISVPFSKKEKPPPPPARLTPPDPPHLLPPLGHDPPAQSLISRAGESIFSFGFRPLPAPPCPSGHADRKASPDGGSPSSPPPPFQSEGSAEEKYAPPPPHN